MRRGMKVASSADGTVRRAVRTGLGWIGSAVQRTWRAAARWMPNAMARWLWPRKPLAEMQGVQKGAVGQWSHAAVAGGAHRVGVNWLAAYWVVGLRGDRYVKGRGVACGAGRRCNVRFDRPLHSVPGSC